MLLLVLLDHGFEELELLGLDDVGDLLLELVDPAVGDVLAAGQLHLGDALAGGPFDGAQHAPFPRRHEQDRLAVAAGPAGAADAVDVGFGVVRERRS